MFEDGMYLLGQNGRGYLRSQLADLIPRPDGLLQLLAIELGICRPGAGIIIIISFFIFGC